MNYELAKAELAVAYYNEVFASMEAAGPGTTKLEWLKARYDLDLAKLEVERLKSEPETQVYYNLIAREKEKNMASHPILEAFLNFAEHYAPGIKVKVDGYLAKWQAAGGILTPTLIATLISTILEMMSLFGSNNSLVQSIEKLLADILPILQPTPPVVPPVVS